MSSNVGPGKDDHLLLLVGDPGLDNQLRQVYVLIGNFLTDDLNSMSVAGAQLLDVSVYRAKVTDQSISENKKPLMVNLMMAKSE